MKIELLTRRSSEAHRREAETHALSKLIRRMMVGFRARLDDELKNRHVTTAQLRLLYEVRERPGGSGAQLARACYVSPQSAQTMLARAVERGWVTRGKDPENDRLVTMRLTPAGRKLLEYAEGVVKTIEAEVWSDVALTELKAVHSVLERAVAKLGE